MKVQLTQNGTKSDWSIDDSIIQESVEIIITPLLKIFYSILIGVVIGLIMSVALIGSVNLWIYHYGASKSITVSLNNSPITYKSVGGVVYSPVKRTYTFIDDQNNKKTSISGNVIIQSDRR